MLQSEGRSRFWEAIEGPVEENVCLMVLVVSEEALTYPAALEAEYRLVAVAAADHSRALRRHSALVLRAVR